MTTRKRRATSAIEEQTTLQTKNPLVFISHDTRDHELAEAFSILLKKASAGSLKSFRSSDKKGTQGIDYGLEWYPAIMNKIEEATEVVCMLTQRSVDRPWILYEAGVAKGKLGKNVIGLALGVTNNVAFTGPFAQFQNNDGSVESITKLVIDLVKKVPGNDPDTNLISSLVTDFHANIQNILTVNKDQQIDKANNNDNIPTKLFEEVKLMFEKLPSKISERVNGIERKRRRMHPAMFEDIMHFGGKFENTNLSFLMLVSLYKDEFPWFYEIGLETYRGLKATKNKIEREKLLNTFENAIEMLGHPMMIEFYGESKEGYMLMKESRHIMRHFIERFYRDAELVN